jgi:hypothetical protein
MDVALWIAQVVLALVFGAAGTIKLSRPKEKLAPNMGWVEDFSAGFVKFGGGIELLGALGLILPGPTGSDSGCGDRPCNQSARGGSGPSSTRRARVDHRQHGAGRHRRIQRLGSVPGPSPVVGSGPEGRLSPVGSTEDASQ